MLCVCTKWSISQPFKKKNEILLSTATLMELEDIMLSDRSQRKKYCMISLVSAIKKGRGQKQTHSYREQSSGCREEGVGRWARMGKREWEVRAPRCGVNKSRGWQVQHEEWNP